MKSDLARLGGGVSWLRLEPDAEAEVSEQENVRNVRWAAAATNGNVPINLYAQRGCSSTYRVNHDLVKRYSRDDYYVLVGHVEVEAKQLDVIATENCTAPPAFLKIDIQGMEIECFNGAQELLRKCLVGVRTEVSLLSVYEQQPLFADVDGHLRSFGFDPMQWIELHHWRRLTKRKAPKLADGPVPYSKGQMVHGDVLYLRQPEDMPAEQVEDLAQIARLGMISVCYDLFDHAAAAFEQSGVRDFCRSVAGMDALQLVYDASRKRAKRYSRIRMLGRRMVDRLL